MNTKVAYLLLGVLFISAGGAAAAGQDPRPERGRSIGDYNPFRPQEEAKIRPSPPYTNKRWIGLLARGFAACPPVEGWKQSSLADALGNYQQGADRKLLRQLERFCIYNNQDGTKGFPTQLPAGLVKAGRDRMALTATSVPDLGEIGDQSWRVLADHFIGQVGQVRLAGTATPRVRLVFIDSHPTGEWPLDAPSSGASWHGYTMAYLAREIGCPGAAPCPLEIATRLVLRYDHYDPDMPLLPPGSPTAVGSRIGSVDDLAVAVLEEVAHWQSVSPEKKLVLNISVGWDGEVRDDGRRSDLWAHKAAKMDLSTQRVYAALRYAARRGALVIAAAGNSRGGRPDTRWPVLPAAWELRRPTWLPFSLGHKPLYAVGGVDWQGLPLANSRHRGMPRRAAFGDHAITRTRVPGPDSEGTTEMYTGTSVSAAVASSIAAVLWQLRPDLSAAAVMQIMEESADVLDSRADFYAWRPLSPLICPPHVRRLSLGSSVVQMCGPDGRRCPPVEVFDFPLWRHRTAELSTIAVDHRLTTSFSLPRTSLDSCSTRRFFIATARVPDHLSSEELCPVEMLPDMTNAGWLGPQPEENPCPTCTIVPEPPRRASLFSLEGAERKEYALLAEIDPRWRGTSLTSAVLVLDCYTEGTARERFTFDLAPHLTALSSSAVRIALGSIDDRDTLAGCTASLDFSVRPPDESLRSVRSPIYVDP